MRAVGNAMAPTLNVGVAAGAIGETVLVRQIQGSEVHVGGTLHTSSLRFPRCLWKPSAVPDRCRVPQPSPTAPLLRPKPDVVVLKHPKDEKLLLRRIVALEGAEMVSDNPDDQAFRSGPRTAARRPLLPLSVVSRPDVSLYSTVLQWSVTHRPLTKCCFPQASAGHMLGDCRQRGDPRPMVAPSRRRSVGCHVLTKCLLAAPAGAEPLSLSGGRQQDVRAAPDRKHCRAVRTKRAPRCYVTFGSSGWLRPGRVPARRAVYSCRSAVDHGTIKNSDAAMSVSPVPCRTREGVRFITYATTDESRRLISQPCAPHRRTTRRFSRQS